MVVAVVARYQRGQGWISGVDGVDEIREMCPLVQTDGHSCLAGLDVCILGVVRLILLSKVDAAVARGHADVVGPTNVLSKLYIFVTFRHGLVVLVDVSHDLVKCSPSVTWKQAGLAPVETEKLGIGIRCRKEKIHKINTRRYRKLNF